MKPLSIAAIGECMIELSMQPSALWDMNFAGDTFNTLWTMRGLLPDNTTLDFVSAFGDDPFSQKQRGFFTRHSIGISHSPTISGKCPGLYAITLDGYERSFTYWRDQSAARRLADDESALANSLQDRDLVYLSGITLAILTPAARVSLLRALINARVQGSSIAFDPNYRPRLWSNAEEAKIAMNDIIKICDIVLPTQNDETALYGEETPASTLDRLTQTSVSEIVVKCGSEPACYSANGARGEVAAETVKDPVDSTGAGDAFNGAYLACRLAGTGVQDSIQFAHKIAARALQTRGALIHF